MLNFARGFRRLGFDVTLMVSCVNDVPRCRRTEFGFDVCCVYTLPDKFTVDETRHMAVDVGIKCQEMAEMYDLLVAHDYHTGYCMMFTSFAIPSIYYVHTPARLPWEIAGAYFSHALAFNSKLSMNTFFGIYRDIFTMELEDADKLLKYKSVSVVYPAPPEPMPAKRTDYWRQLTGKDVVVAVLTRKEWYKGINEAVNALHGLDVGVLIAGKGIEKGRKDNIVFLGPISEQDKWSLLSNVDVVLYPSVWEPFGLVPLEAVVAGTPAVVSARTGVAEVLPGPKFDPANPQDIREKVLYVIKHRDEVLEVQRESWIIRRRWTDVAEQLVRIAENIKSLQTAMWMRSI